MYSGQRTVANRQRADHSENSLYFTVHNVSGIKKEDDAPGTHQASFSGPGENGSIKCNHDLQVGRAQSFLAVRSVHHGGLKAERY